MPNAGSGAQDLSNAQNPLSNLLGGMNPPFGGQPGGAGNFLGGFDMNAASMAGFNPYLFPFAQPGAAGIMNPNWFAGMPAGVPGVPGVPSMQPGSSSSFHAPGAKNEIKLFVGGLPF